MLKHHRMFTLLREVPYTTVKNKHAEYINLACGFDIETTSAEDENGKVAFMYIWMLGIGHGENIYYGRTWEEAKEAFDYITSFYGLGEKRRIVVYVHNLAYEFQFMAKHFEWGEIFASKPRKPLKAITKSGIEFRDSLILSGYSLEGTAKNLTKYKVSKAVGDLDYSLPRHHNTPLTDKEMGYCKRDIEVVTAYIQEQIEIYGHILKIPMTNTGRVRQYVKDLCFFNKKEAGIDAPAKRRTKSTAFAKYRKIMKSLTLEPEHYTMLVNAFAGGFTHANPKYVGKTLENVSSIDFTSSYPSVMVSEKFPMSRFKEVIVKTIDQLEEVCAKRCVVFNVRFTNLKATFTNELYISESKCKELSNPVEFNGRLFSADTAALTIIDTDWHIIKRCYQWDKMEISSVYCAHKGYLPKPILEACAELYVKKTVLKGVEGSEVEYMVSKGMLNSLYGMCVTSIIQDDTIYLEDEWAVEPADVEGSIEDYNNNKMRFLYYAWGVWITGYARANLWSGIFAVGDDYVYSDTDSLKVLNYEKHKNYTTEFDNQITAKIATMLKETKYSIDPEAFHPKTQKGEEKPIGVWDYEGTYDQFKTLGAKRYLTRKGDKVELTVAGVPKKKGVEYIKQLADGDYDKLFNEIFDNHLTFPEGSTGKLTHTYINYRIDYQCEDYLGNVEDVHPESGIHLAPAAFNLSMSDRTLKFLNDMVSGKIYLGVKYQ